MPLPQDIRPVFQDIQDTLVRSDSPWIERSPQDKLKILWIGQAFCPRNRSGSSSRCLCPAKTA